MGTIRLRQTLDSMKLSELKDSTIFYEQPPPHHQQLPQVRKQGHRYSEGTDGGRYNQIVMGGMSTPDASAGGFLERMVD